MPSYQTAVDSRSRQAKKDAKAKRSRQMAGMRDLAAIRRSPSTLAQLGIYNAPPYYMKGEIKSVDIPSSSFGLSTTAVITPINLISAGSSYFNRIGRKITLKSLHVKLFLDNLRTTASADYLRIMVVYDGQSNGSLPSISDIIQDTDQTGTNATYSSSSTNLNNRDRFRVLADWRLVPPTCTNTAGVITNLSAIDPVQPLMDLERYIKLKGLSTQYKADSSPAVIGDIATGALLLVTYGRVASGSEGWRALGSLRLRYTDN